MLISKMSQSGSGYRPPWCSSWYGGGADRGTSPNWYELDAMETGFPMGDGPEEHEDLLEEFTMAAEAVVDITSA